MTAFLLGDIIFGTAWLILFLAFPKTRKLQLFGSLLLIPFGFLDYWFRINYWHPPLLISAIAPFSFETPIYCFAAGGVAAMIGNLFVKKDFSWQSLNFVKIIIFFLASTGLFFLFYLLKANAMNSLNFTFLAVWLFLMVTNLKDIKINSRSLLAGILVSLFTILAINLGNLNFPGFVLDYWNTKAIWPLFLGTPTEEIFFAGIMTALWAILLVFLQKPNQKALTNVNG